MGEVEERRKGFSSAGSWRDIRPPDPLMGEIEKLLDNFFSSETRKIFVETKPQFWIAENCFLC